MTNVNGTGILTAVVNVTAAGNTTVIAALAGQNIHVCKVLLYAASAVDFDFIGSTPISGIFKAVTSMNADFEGHMKCGLGNPLIINQGTAVVTGGIISYYLTNTPN